MSVSYSQAVEIISESIGGELGEQTAAEILAEEASISAEYGADSAEMGEHVVITICTAETWQELG